MPRKSPFNYERYDFPCTPDCVDRHPGCHGECERYLKARAARDEINAARYAKHQTESYTIDSVNNRRDQQAKNRKNRPHNKYHTH